MKRSFLFWLAAIVIMFAAVVFQRATGPTYPKKVKLEVDTISVTLKLPRSHEIDKVVQIELPALSWEWTAKLYHRPYPVDTAWTEEPPFWPEGDKFVSYLPTVSQKAAKLEYYIKLENFGAGTKIYLPEEPIVIRFKGSVPAWALIPHIILLFIAMIFSNLAGLMALFKNDRYKFWGLLSLVLIFLGGLVFGPIVQKYAFDHYWTGFPFGSDLTDNKTLIMFLVWAVAVVANLKKNMPWVTVLASLITILVYCIPHSMRGSQFDYESGEIVTGVVTYLKYLVP